jgi:hypothetical protein
LATAVKPFIPIHTGIVVNLIQKFKVAWYGKVSIVTPDFHAQFCPLLMNQYVPDFSAIFIYGFEYPVYFYLLCPAFDYR